MVEQKKLSQEQVGWVLDTFAAGGQIGRIAEDLGVDPELVAREIRGYVHRNRDEDPTRAGLANLSYQVAQLRDELDDLRREVRASKPDLEAVANRLLAKSPSPSDWRKAFAYDRARMEPTEQRARESAGPRAGGMQEIARKLGVDEAKARELRDAPPVGRAWVAPEEGWTRSSRSYHAEVGAAVAAVPGVRAWDVHGRIHRDSRMEPITRVFVDAPADRLHEVAAAVWRTLPAFVQLDGPHGFGAEGCDGVVRLNLIGKAAELVESLRPGEHTTWAKIRDGSLPIQVGRDERAVVAASVRSDPDALARLGLTVADVDALAGRREGQ